MKILSLIMSFLIIGELYSPSTKWLTSLDEGKKVSKIQRKPLLVLYYLDNDEDSKKFLKMLQDDKEISNNLKNFVCVKINSSGKTEFSKYPVIQFFSLSGKECLMQRVVGLVDNWEVNNNLNLVLSRTTDVTNKKFDPFVFLPRRTFNKGESINIRFKVLERGYCSIKIKNSKGDLIKNLFLGVKKPDIYNIEWKQLDKDNKQVESGTYTIFFELSSYKDIIEVNII